MSNNHRRTADLTVSIRTTATEAFETWTYRLRLEAADPLVEGLISGGIAGSDVLVFTLGAAYPDAFDLPSFERVGPGGPVEVQFSAPDVSYALDAGRVNGLILFVGPRDGEGRPLRQQMVSELTATMECSRCRVVKVLGMPTATHTTTTVEFAGFPDDTYVEMQSTERPSAVPDAQDDTGLAEPDEDAAERELSFVLLPFAYLVPWLVLVFAAQRAGILPRYRRSWVVGVLVMSAVGVLAILSALGIYGSLVFRLLFAMLTVVFPAAVWWRSRRDAPTLRQVPGTIWVSFGLSYVLAAIVIVRSPRGEEWLGAATPPAFVLVTAIVTSLIGAVALASAWKRRWLIRPLAMAFVAACCAGIVGSVASISVDSGYLLFAVTGISWVPVALLLADLAATTARTRIVVRLIATAGGVLLLVPVGLAVTDPDQLFFRVSHLSFDWLGSITVGYATAALNLALLVVLITFLIRRGGHVNAVADPTVRAAAIALIVLAVTPIRWGAASAALVTAAAAVSFAWLLPASRVGQSIRLARISRRAHRRLLLAESWRRLTEDASLAHFRAAGVEIATNPTADAAQRSRQRSLDDLQRPAATVSVTEAALGSYGGRAPVSSGGLGVQISTALAAPMIAYGVFLVWNKEFTNPEHLYLIDWITIARFELRWLAYGFVFGYCYPFLRGSTPVAKSTALLVALLVPELVDFVPRIPATGLGALAWVVVTGQIVVYCLGLGLVWEMRIVHRGGLPWGRIRNFHQLRALSAPFTAIAVTVATTAAAAVVGAAMAGYLGTTPGPGNLPQPAGVNSSTPQRSPSPS